MKTCYCMSMLDRRLQVLIDEERWARLEAEARRRNVAVSTLVREAIDERYPGRDEERRAALRALLDAEPMPVPEVDSLPPSITALPFRSTCVLLPAAMIVPPALSIVEL